MHFERIIKQMKERREALQVTQEMLADISGVSLRTLKQFESGKGNPTLETLTKLSDALGLEVYLHVKSQQPNA
jgi:transcriptional regulator with XRE-family HTH domain